MSSIAFHSLSKTVRVSGRERAHMGMCVERWFAQSMGLTDVFPDSDPPLWYIAKDDHHVKVGGRDCFRENMKYGLNGMFGNPLQYFDGTELKEFDAFEAMLNTALSIGSDPVKLYARLHGQCEIHAYVKGKNRNWIADIIQNGLDIGLYRKDAAGYDGWDEVIKFLRSRKDEDVVTSYSVCDSFPNCSVAMKAGYKLPFYKNEDGTIDENEYDDTSWDELTDEKRWKLAFKGLDPVLEMKPTAWDYKDYHFTENLTGYQIFAGALARRSMLNSAK